MIALNKKKALKIPNEQRWKVREALEKSKPIKTNISKEERPALKSLQGDENIIILPTDKGNATAVMDKKFKWTAIPFSGLLHSTLDTPYNAEC